jgi:hypothetical protein
MTPQYQIRADRRLAANDGRAARLQRRWRPHWGDALALTGLALLIAGATRMANKANAPRGRLTAEPTIQHIANAILGAVGTPHRVDLLIDVSGSMDEPAPTSSIPASKWDIVKLGIASFVRDLPETTIVGVRVFGQSAGRCAPSERLRAPAPLGSDGATSIVASLDRLGPCGDTPLADALGAAVEDLGAEGGQVLLLSDGVDTCAGRAAACVAAGAAATRRPPVRIDIVRTFMSDDEGQALACIAEATGGTAVDLVRADAEELTGLLFRAMPLRVTAALLLTAFGWLTFFLLCSLLADALGVAMAILGRAGFIADAVFAMLAAAWAAFWLIHLARLPLLLAVVIVGAALAFLYRELPRRRTVQVATPSDACTGGIR